MTEQHVALAPAVLAAGLVREGTRGVDGVLAQAAQQLAATRIFTDQEIDDAAVLMAKMSGAEPEGAALRRNRKLLTKLRVAPSVAARERR